METDQRQLRQTIEDPAGGDVTLSPVEARQSVKLGVMRWVLGVSLALAIVAMIVAYFVA